MPRNKAGIARYMCSKGVLANAHICMHLLIVHVLRGSEATQQSDPHSTEAIGIYDLIAIHQADNNEKSKDGPQIMSPPPPSPDTAPRLGWIRFSHSRLFTSMVISHRQRPVEVTVCPRPLSSQKVMQL